MNEEWFPKYDPNDNSLEENAWVEAIKNELPANFSELRKQGENESYLCKLIRGDSVEDFIAYVHKNNISRNATINPSIYETNSFLIKKQSRSYKGISLIEYAAFFGSIQILTFLKYEGVELEPLLWLGAIHSNNAELIHFLENNHVEPVETSFLKDKISHEIIFKESIKCHHNDIANYILDNFIKNKGEISGYTIIHSLKYYNFTFVQKEQINKTLFYHLCHYDYFSLVKELLESNDVNINSKVVQNHAFQ